MRKLAICLSISQFIAVSAASHLAAQSNQCKTLKDSDNDFTLSIGTNFYEATGDEIAEVPFEDIFDEFHEALPWFSTCLASIDPKAVYDSLATSSSYCLKAVQNLEYDFETVNEAMTKLVCPFIEFTGIKCVETVMNTVMNSISETNNCCDEFRDKIVELFSDPLPDMVNKLVRFGANIGCSTRKFTNLAGESTTENCAASIIGAFSYFDAENITDYAQIPNEAECAAFEGLQFTNTKGSSSHFPFNNMTDSMGICLQPVDSLMRHLRSWPFFQQIFDAGAKGKFSLANLFSTGTYIRGDLFIEWALKSSNLPMILVRTFDKYMAEIGLPMDSSEESSEESSWTNEAETVVTELGKSLKSYARAFAAHLPNSASCNYPGQTIVQPYPVSSTASINPVVTPVPNSSPPECKTLGDKESDLMFSLMQIFSFNDTDIDDIPFEDIFSEVDSALPWLSTCLASTDIVSVVVAARTSSSARACLSRFGDLLDQDVSDTLDEIICSNFNQTIIPCLHDVMAEVMFILNSTSGCCDAFQAKIKELFLDPFPEMINKIVHHAANISCSQRTFTNVNDETISESCGYSIVNSFSDFDFDEDLFNFAMMPNSGMCDAFEGNLFSNTKGNTTQFPFNNETDSMGICLRPIDSFIKYVRSWPFFNQTLDAGDNYSLVLSDLFASGKSIQADLFIRWAVQPTNLPKIIGRMIDMFVGNVSDAEEFVFWDDSIDSYLDDLSDYEEDASAYLAHIPNGGQCSYPKQTLTTFVSTIPSLMAIRTTPPVTSAPTMTTTPSTTTPAATKTNTTTQSANSASTLFPEMNVMKIVLALLLLVAWVL